MNSSPSEGACPSWCVLLNEENIRLHVQLADAEARCQAYRLTLERLLGGYSDDVTPVVPQRMARAFSLHQVEMDEVRRLRLRLARVDNGVQVTDEDLIARRMEMMELQSAVHRLRVEHSALCDRQLATPEPSPLRATIEALQQREARLREREAALDRFLGGSVGCAMPEIARLERLIERAEELRCGLVSNISGGEAAHGP